MNFFEKIFGTKREVIAEPAIRFGRYSDSLQKMNNPEFIANTMKLFDKELYLEAYQAFLQSLYNEEEENIRVWQEKGTIKFEFYQGSKKISGYANQVKFYAESRIAKAKSLHSSFMRRLLEENYELKYCRFTLTPEDEIAIIFDSYTLDGSPLKLYAALRELAIHADKHDDIMIEEFDALEQVDRNIRRELPVAEKEIKYNFIISEIKEVLTLMDEGKLNQDRYPVAYTLLLLCLCYKLDYLTKPEGFMMEVLERIHRLTFANDGKNVPQKNLLLRKEFQKLLDRPKEKFFSEMYEVQSTFGIALPVDHRQLAQLIEQELPNMKWYIEQGHEKIALAVPGFIIGQSLFNYQLPEPDKALFHLLFQIMEPEYFGALGFRIFSGAKGLDEKAIKQELQSITEKYQPLHPQFRPDTRQLVFSSLPLFAESFLMMVKELNLSKGN